MSGGAGNLMWNGVITAFHKSRFCGRMSKSAALRLASAALGSHPATKVPRVEGGNHPIPHWIANTTGPALVTALHYD